MKYRFLGDTGLLVSRLSFGSWVTFHDQMNFEKSYSILKHAYEKGINFFDNAEAYADGESEIMMGKAIAQGIKDGVWQREDLVISTKIFFGTRSGPNQCGCSRKHIIEGTKASLKRFNMDYVDLIFCHRRDVKTPIEETVRAMNFVIEQGWAFYWGTSEWNAHDIIEACEIADRLNLIRPVFDQPQYNILERSRVEYDYAPLYKKYKYGLTIWSPLAAGILTGKYSKGIPKGSRLAMEETKKVVQSNMTHITHEDQIKMADKLIPIAQEVGCSLAQLSIAWCIANEHVSTCILGATSIEQLDENLKSVEFVDKITPEIREKIDAVVQFKVRVLESAEPRFVNMMTQYL